MSAASGAGWRFDDLIRPPAHLRAHGIEPPWNILNDQKAAELFARISPIDGRLHAGPDTEVSAFFLPWYENVLLFRVFDPGWSDPDVIVYYLLCKGALVRLDGASAPIHEVNALAPLNLNAGNVLDYLRFFCFFVHGDEGPFYLLESADHPMLDFAMNETAQRVFEAAARPASIEGVAEAGGFICEAVQFYANALWTARLEVQLDGVIEMIDDEPIASGLPVRLVAKLSAVLAH